MRLARPQGFLGPTFQGGRQPGAYFETPAAHPTLDFLLELPRDALDFELVNHVLCEERVKDQFCNVERRKMQHLELDS